jgi:hypothetical protein
VGSEPQRSAVFWPTLPLRGWPGRGVIQTSRKCAVVPRFNRVARPPARYDRAQRSETASRSAQVAQPAVEALDKAVLLRFARGDVVTPDAGLLGPAQDRPAGQLGVVVGDAGGRRWTMMASSSRPTRRPGKEVSELGPDLSLEEWIPGYEVGS